MNGSEVWKVWPKNEKTMVSSLGRVMSHRGNILSPRKNTNGYLRVQVPSPCNNYKDQYIHRMVCETFLGPPDGEMHADHIDKNRENNRLSNLRWRTPKENRGDRVFPLGLDRSGTKLSDEMVREIRKAKGSQREISVIFGISREHVRDIRSGRERRHVE